MPAVSRRWWVIAAVAIALVSAAALAQLASGATIPSVVRTPLAWFVEPGVTVWWFILGTLFAYRPTTLMGIAFAAVVNTLLWLLAARLAVAGIHCTRRIFARLR